MKVIIDCIIVFMLMLNNTCSQSTIETDKLIGGWRISQVQENDGQRHIVECPDFLMLKKGQRYRILNDCYGADAREPVIEQGSWSYNPSNKTLILRNRQFHTKYAFYDSSQVLVTYVRSVSEEEMKICFEDKPDCNSEKYERLYHKKEIYTGTGTATKKLTITGKVNTMKITQEFYQVPDQLVVEDQDGNELYRGKQQSTTDPQSRTISLRGVRQLKFKVDNEKPSSKWKITVELQ